MTHDRYGKTLSLFRRVSDEAPGRPVRAPASRDVCAPDHDPASAPVPRPETARSPLTEREIVLVIGRTGSGKSTWTKQAVADLPRVLVFDPFRSYPGIVWLEGDGDPIGDLFDRYPEGLRRYRFGSEDDIEGLGLLAYCWGHTTLVVEEAADVFRPFDPPPDWARWAVYKGRHRRESLIVVAQRASSIPIWLRSQATRFVTFTQTEPNDIRWLAGLYPRDWLERLPSLPVLTCYDRHGAELSTYRLTLPRT